MSDARFDDSLVYDERETELSIPHAFYQTLQRGGLVDDYSHWKKKTKGGMPGLILLGSVKGCRDKVYVKRYPLVAVASKFEHELIDYAVFKIMGQCGARTPKVELKIFENQAYLFSTHLAQQKEKHRDKQYWFKIFYRHKLQINTDRNVLSLRPKLFDCGDEFQIDKLEVARVLILGVILNLFDFHHGNIGMVASSAGKAKLALVDFLVNPKRIVIEDGVLELIRLKYDQAWTCSELQALITLLDEDIFSAAFKKIEDNFTSACDYVVANIAEIKLNSDAKRADFSAALEIWKLNFSEVKKFLQKPAKSHRNRY